MVSFPRTLEFNWLSSRNLHFSVCWFSWATVCQPIGDIWLVHFKLLFLPAYISLFPDEHVVQIFKTSVPVDEYCAKSSKYTNRVQGKTPSRSPDTLQFLLRFWYRNFREDQFYRGKKTFVSISPSWQSLQTSKATQSNCCVCRRVAMVVKLQLGNLLRKYLRERRNTEHTTTDRYQ